MVFFLRKKMIKKNWLYPLKLKFRWSKFTPCVALRSGLRTKPFDRKFNFPSNRLGFFSPSNLVWPIPVETKSLILFAKVPS